GHAVPDGELHLPRRSRRLLRSPSRLVEGQLQLDGRGARPQPHAPLLQLAHRSESIAHGDAEPWDRGVPDRLVPRGAILRGAQTARPEACDHARRASTDQVPSEAPRDALPAPTLRGPRPPKRNTPESPTTVAEPTWASARAPRCSVK